MDKHHLMHGHSPAVYPPKVLGGAHAKIRPEDEDMGEVLTKNTIGRV